MADREETFQQVLSLGPSCRAKANIQRVFGRRTARRYVFDWQTTSPAGLLDYFRNDFTGAFERADLTVAAGVVCNRKYDTRHPHEFPKGITEERLDALYPAARALHEGWCAALRKAIDNRYSALFVLSEPLPEQDRHVLADLIADRCKQKRYLILDAPAGDYERDDGDGFSWMGDRDLWQRHLSGFSIEPPLPTRISYQLHRLRRNMTYLVPKRLRKPKQVTPLSL